MIQVTGYHIKREIGSGGMATVYLAVQASLEREVALKVMNPALVSDPNFSRRFLLEARTLASLSHPNIVAVYDVGVTDSQLHYFSMQHLPGGDLIKRIKQGATEPEIVRVLTGVGRALGFAHVRGFVHRDVSPANILFDASDNPILTDFGIARAVTRTSRLTNAGVSVGTSHYMSPEQARGGNVDARSDIYSLGCVTYEGLTGKPPYDGEDGFAIAYAHVFEPVPRLAPALAHWQPLVDKALAKDPRDRFTELDAFLEALDLVSKQVAMPTASVPRPPAPRTEELPSPLGPATIRTPVPTEVVEALNTAPIAAPSFDTQPVAAPVAASATASPMRRIVPAVLLVGAGVLGLGLAYWLAFGGREPQPELVGPGVAATTPTPRPSVGPTAATPSASPTPYATTDTTPLDYTIEPTEDALLAGPESPDDERARQSALVMTAQDPVNLLLAIGRSDLQGQRLAQPPGRNALERFRLALQLAEHFKATREAERARQGIAETAGAYIELGEKSLAADKFGEFVEYLGRADEIAVSVPEGEAVLARTRARRSELRDRLLADARKALSGWDKPVAVAAYERAIALDPKSEEAQRGLKSAQRIGDVGFVFRDTLAAGAQGPELVIVNAGSRKLAVARSEATLGEFRAYWQAQGQRTRGGDRPACRDRESFFRSSRKNTFEAPAFTPAATHPVVCVAWADAADYAQWLSKATGKRYRLPTAAEWTALARSAKPAACRANLADQSYGNRYRERDVQSCDDGFAETAPVRRFDATSGGVYDIAGNAREWVGDCAPGCKEHVAMGSAWHSVPGEADAAQRASFGADLALNTVGFRVVRELD